MNPTPHARDAVPAPNLLRRPATIIGAAVLVLLALSITSTAAIASGSHHQRPVQIHIVTTVTSQVTQSAGLGGPGDLVATVFSFPLPNGESGHVAGSATLVSATEQLSHVAFVFPDGQIDAQAALTLPPTHFVAAILGGTGAYEGVGGQVVNNVTPGTPLTIDRTLYLIYPHGHR